MPRTKALAAVALGVVLLAGCGGGGDGDVVQVGKTALTQKQLDAVVTHFRTVAKGEGRPFPAAATGAFRQLRNRLLGLLVYREELRQAAERLGVKVN